MTTNLDSIRRMLDDKLPIPPWIVRGLVEEIEGLRDTLDEAAAALLSRPIRTDFDKTLAAQMRARLKEL